jgi:hypothetical protein
VLRTRVRATDAALVQHVAETEHRDRNQGSVREPELRLHRRRGRVELLGALDALRPDVEDPRQRHQSGNPTSRNTTTNVIVSPAA